MLGSVWLLCAIQLKDNELTEASVVCGSNSVNNKQTKMANRLKSGLDKPEFCCYSFCVPIHSYCHQLHEFLLSNTGIECPQCDISFLGTHREVKYCKILVLLVIRARNLSAKMQNPPTALHITVFSNLYQTCPKNDKDVLSQYDSERPTIINKSCISRNHF